jgi:hypothetical protein
VSFIPVLTRTLVGADMVNNGNQGTAGFAEPAEDLGAQRHPAADRLPPPLDLTPLLGRLGSPAPRQGDHALPGHLRATLWLLLAADAALAGCLILTDPAPEGGWRDVVAAATLGGHVNLTIWLALATTAALVGCALATRGFLQGTGPQWGLAAAAATAAALSVGGAVLVVVAASSLFVLVGGLALLLFGAVTERDDRP